MNALGVCGSRATGIHCVLTLLIGAVATTKYCNGAHAMTNEHMRVVAAFRRDTEGRLVQVPELTLEDDQDVTILPVREGVVLILGEIRDHEWVAFDQFS